MENLVRFSILGLGSIGCRHARNLLHMGHRVDGHDPNFDPSNPHHQAVLVNGLRIRVSNEELLGNDGLLVCTPTPLHIDGVLWQDQMPVFVEKPMFDLATRPAWSVIKDRKIAVGYNLRFHPLVKQAREWLKEGIGEPVWAMFILGQHNEKYEEHVALNWSHEIDLARHLMSPWGGLGLHMSREDPQMTRIEFSLEENNSPVFVHLDYISKPWIRKFMIQGTERRIEVDLERAKAYRFDSGDGPPMYPDVNEQTRNACFDQSYVDEIAQFVKYCETGELGDLAGVQDGDAALHYASEIMR